MKGRVPPSRTAVLPPTTQTSPSSPQSKVVFIGSTDVDGVMIAMFEDTAAGKIVQCHVGDTIAGGKIAGLTLDTLTYLTNGRSMKIALGQNLDAGEAPPVDSRASITDSGFSSGSNSSSSGSADSDIIAKMKARHRAGQ
jgi:hypothetical protein